MDPRDNHIMGLASSVTYVAEKPEAAEGEVTSMNSSTNASWYTDQYSEVVWAVEAESHILSFSSLLDAAFPLCLLPHTSPTTRCMRSRYIL